MSTEEMAKQSIAIYQSIAATFWSLSKFICRLSMINSSSFDSILFGSTYLRDEAFSQMKILKSRYRNRLTDERLKYRLHLCLSNY
jgi:hypothetical protein